MITETAKVNVIFSVDSTVFIANPKVESIREIQQHVSYIILKIKKKKAT